MPVTRSGRLQRSSVTATTVGATALWGLLGLSLVSVTVRPLVRALELPKIVVNLDALLTPFVTIAVVVLAALSWSSLPRLHRLLTAGVVMLGLSMAISWLVAAPRSWASLALGGSVLLLLPLALYLVVMAALVPNHLVVRRTVALMVLLQLAVGLVQYVALSVAQKAPAGADLVDGTTSHNFWPAFALPASLVLVLTSRDRTRFLWPIAVALLAVYAEAKAALIVWLPMIVVVGSAHIIGRWRAGRTNDQGRAEAAQDPMARLGLVLVCLAAVIVGLWWTPSVQGTWSVFIGHTRALEEFAVTGSTDDAAPTLRQAATAVRESLTADPVAALFGRGPANTTSHAAEILAQGTQNGSHLPPPGPLATELLTGGDALKFRDAQSSLLGVLGDLGMVGAGLYVFVCGLCTWAMFRSASSVAFRSSHSLTVVWIVAGLLAGGSLLDWPEQAAIVLPVLLATLMLAAPPRDPAINGRESEAVRASTRSSTDGVNRAGAPAVKHDSPPASSSVAECTS